MIWIIGIAFIVAGLLSYLGGEVWNSHPERKKDGYSRCVAPQITGIVLVICSLCLFIPAICYGVSSKIEAKTYPTMYQNIVAEKEIIKTMKQNYKEQTNSSTINIDMVNKDYFTSYNDKLMDFYKDAKNYNNNLAQKKAEITMRFWSNNWGDYSNCEFIKIDDVVK